MIRLSAVVLLLLGATGCAFADDAAPAAPATAQQGEIASCKGAEAQITPLLKATEDYAKAVATLGPGDADTSMPGVLTGARRAALGNVFKDFKAIRPSLEQLQGDLEVLTVVVNACKAGELTP